MMTLEIKPEPSYKLQGLELTAAMQAIFCKSLREQKRKESTHLCTTIKLDIMRYAVEEFNKKFPTDKQIWHSLKNRDTPRKITGFLYKNLHDAY